MIELSAEPQAYTYFVFLSCRPKNTQISKSDVINKPKLWAEHKNPH
jgi:hypothetical protein